MNIYLKKFLQRGLSFGGFGPIIASFVYFIISLCIDDFSLTGSEIFLGIVSTYMLAFLQAGASVFNQIEEWSVGRSLLCHFATVYTAYIGCYLINTWIPFDLTFISVFTLIFTAVYAVIWFSVFLSVKAVSKKLNKKIK